jgi:hypothetical protein
VRNRSILDDPEALKRKHADVCDYAEARLWKHEEEFLESISAADTPHHGWIKRDDLTLFLTCRVAFVIARPYRTVSEKANDLVTLVLPGDDRMMTGEKLAFGPVNFDPIQDSIVERISESAVRVKVETAIHFLAQLEKRVESANPNLKQMAAHRRESHRENMAFWGDIYLGFVRKACLEGKRREDFTGGVSFHYERVAKKLKIGEEEEKEEAVAETSSAVPEPDSGNEHRYATGGTVCLRSWL